MIAFFLNVSDTRKINVVESDKVSILCGVGESKFSLRSCCFWIDVKLDRNGGVCELHILNMYSVTPEHQLLAVAFEHIVSLAGCVSVTRDSVQSRKYLNSPVEGFHLSCFNVRGNGLIGLHTVAGYGHTPGQTYY